MINKTPALALCLLSLCLATMGQERATRQLIVPLADGGFVAFKSETAWADTKRASASAQELRGEFGSQALVDENHVVHRVLMDGSGKLIFGYDLFIAPNAVLKKFKIAVNPLDAQFADKLRARDSDRSEIRISTLPQSAAPQTLDDGDAFALDLLVNQNTGVKIVDIVKVSFDRARLWDTNPKTLPRDFTLEAVELAVKDYRLVINGSVAAT